MFPGRGVLCSSFPSRNYVPLAEQIIEDFNIYIRIYIYITLNIHYTYLSSSIIIPTTSIYCHILINNHPSVIYKSLIDHQYLPIFQPTYHLSNYYLSITYLSTGLRVKPWALYTLGKYLSLGYLYVTGYGEFKRMTMMR